MSNDIEDVGSHQIGASGHHLGTEVNPRSRKRQQTERHGADIPGDATVFVHTFGCGHNVSDGEYMAGQLVSEGYRVTDHFDQADCFLINSCTVKNPSEDHFVNLMKKAKSTGKPVIVAGCVPQGEQNGKNWNDVSVVGVRHIDRVAEVVQEAMRGNTVRYLSANRRESAKETAADATTDAVDESLPPLDLPKVRRNQFIEIIPINVGCLNQCTYCKTKHARGDLRSWPIDEIVGRVRSVLQEGVVREIRLTSEDVGAYGIDLGTDIIALLTRVVQVLEGSDVMLRIGMSNPPYLLRHIHEFGKILLHPNVFEFVHIPVQSGSDAILDTMKREYTVADFQTCVDAILAAAPNTSISTDIICAFPGEGEAEWNETVALCRANQFPILNISRFYARKGTPAAAMPQIRTDIAKKRTVELTELYNSYRTYDALVGTVHTVDLLEVAHDKHHFVGHTKAYVQVLVDPATCQLGDRVTVRIVSASKYSVMGTVEKIVKSTQMSLRRAPAPTANSSNQEGAAMNRPKSIRLAMVGSALALAVIAAAVVVRSQRK